MSAFFPNLSYIWIRRDDKLRQAISLWKAIQSQRWRLDDRATEDGAPLAFSYKAISHLHSRLIEEDKCWDRYFHEVRLSPIIVKYEDLSSSPEGVLKFVLSGLGLDFAVPPDAKLSTMQRQYDSKSEQWLHEFNRIERAHCHEGTLAGIST